MSICNCIHASKKPETTANVAGVMSGLVKFAKVLTYQLKDNDVNHIMDIADFYRLHPELCVSDITSISLSQSITSFYRWQESSGEDNRVWSRDDEEH